MTALDVPEHYDPRPDLDMHPHDECGDECAHYCGYDRMVGGFVYSYTVNGIDADDQPCRCEHHKCSTCGGSGVVALQGPGIAHGVCPSCQEVTR